MPRAATLIAAAAGLIAAAVVAWVLTRNEPSPGGLPMYKLGDPVMPQAPADAFILLSQADNALQEALSAALVLHDPDSLIQSTTAPAEALRPLLKPIIDTLRLNALPTRQRADAYLAAQRITIRPESAESHAIQFALPDFDASAASPQEQSAAVRRTILERPHFQDRVVAVCVGTDYPPRLTVSLARTPDLADPTPQLGDRANDWVIYPQYNGFAPRHVEQPDTDAPGGAVVASAILLAELESGTRVIFMFSLHKRPGNEWAVHRLRMMGDVSFIGVW